MGRQISAFANYAYQHTRGFLEFQVAENGGPKHKVNGGVRIGRDGLTGSLYAHWVDGTGWSDADVLALKAGYTGIDSYLLLNARLGYAFSGDLEGLSVGLEVFNLADRDHFEILPVQGDLRPGLSGEVVRRRATGTVSYRF